MSLIYDQRNKCCFCECNKFTELLQNDVLISPSLNLYEQKSERNLIPYNIVECNKCKVSLIKYLANIDKKIF